MNNKEMTIGQRVRKARKEKGYNQTELANALGKSLRTIQKYENGEIEISIRTLAFYSRYSLSEQSTEPQKNDNVMRRKIIPANLFDV